MKELSKQAKKFLLDRNENKRSFDKMLQKQMGTEVLEFYNSIQTAVINTSSIDIGIIDRMIETDDTISSALEFKKLMATSSIGPYSHENKDIKEFVNDALQKLKGPTWRESIEAQFSHQDFGFSITEKVWGINKKMQKVPVKLATYHPSTICFEMGPTGIASDGVLQFTNDFSQRSNPNYIYSAVRNGWKITDPFSTPIDRLLPKRVPFISNTGVARIPRNKVIHHINKAGRSFGSPYGKTSVRTAHLLWQMKNFFIKQMGIGAKKASTGTVWGQAPASGHSVTYQDQDGNSSQKSAREAMIDMLRNFETSDSIVTGSEKEGYGLQVLQNAVQLGSFSDIINAIDVWIFRCFLIPSLVMTDGSAGSRALGEKHFDIVNQIADADANVFKQTLINELIEEMIIANFGEQDDYGEFLDREKTSDELEKAANLYTMLVDRGILDSFELTDKNYIREALGIPAAKSAGLPPLLEDDDF